MHRSLRFRIEHGFTLIELLVVMAITAVMATLIGPAIGSFNKANGLSHAASEISGMLEQARAYAMGKNTYVYVGLQEVDALAPTSADGVGRLVVAMVASLDGTRPYTSLTDTPSISTNIGVIDKIHSFDNVHLVDASRLTNGANMTNRPAVSVDLAVTAATTTFQWPLSGTPKYRFSKVIEFNPQGVARVQTDTVYKASVSGYIEIPLLPTQGNVAIASSPNQAAIQVDSITGAVRLYRP